MVMKIIRYELFEVSIPTRRVHTWATSTTDVGSGYMIVKLITDDGVEGFGESTAMAEWGGDFGRYYGESSETTRVVIDNYLFPAIEGMEPIDIDLIHRKMDLAIRGYNYAKTGLEEAVYDLLGKALGIPVYRLLGGKNRNSVAIAHSLGIMPIDEAIEEAILAVEEGIKDIKVKGGLDYKRDYELIKLLRENLGPDIRIFIDANQSYPSAKEAIKWIHRMDKEFNLEYVEQPVEGIEELRKVTKGLKIPVCADESCWTIADALDIVRRNATDFISIYTTKASGLYNARIIAKIAENAGIRCNVNGSGEFGVGTAANLHLACAARNADLASVFPVTHIEGFEQTKVAGHWYKDDIIKRPFIYEDGHLIVPDEPGLGIEVDMEKIKKYSVAHLSL